MDSHNLLANYHKFQEQSFCNRFFKHSLVSDLISRLPSAFKRSVAGHSYLDRAVNLVEWGDGKTKVFLWSQMHGDEATGTMALFDLLNFFQTKEEFGEIIDLIKSECTLYFLPMVNPDGAENFTRRNAMQIDVNRDYLSCVSPEAKLLKEVRDRLQPDFGFNLHDQDTLWSVSGTANPATLSFLAPAFDEDRNIDEVRRRSMLVIAEIFERMKDLLPGQIGLFDDEYEPRAFGDNFQKGGMSTILIEAGGLRGDWEKQHIRKYYFLSILGGLISIASNSYVSKDVDSYLAIPKNTKKIFHFLIKDIFINGIKLSIGLNFEERVSADQSGAHRRYYVADIGDLTGFGAYQTLNGSDSCIHGEVVFSKIADFELRNGDKILLSFSDGILTLCSTLII